MDCIVRSVCHVLNHLGTAIDPIDLKKLIGHDGDRIAFPSRTDKFRHSGYHPDEITVAINKLGYVTQTLQRYPVTVGPDNEFFIVGDFKTQIDYLIKNSSGVIYWLPSHATANINGVHPIGGTEIDSYTMIMKFHNQINSQK
jgi:hypothetical protein